MALFLFINSPNQKETSFYLRDRAVIGRKKNIDIRIENPTVSSRHAQVERIKGKVYLNSLSPRGIFLNKKVCERIELKSGLTFSLGEVSFEVKNSIEKLPPLRSLLLITFNHLAKTEQIAQISHKKVFPFPYRLQLQIIEGRQKGIKWSVGYGPRYIGTDSVDFPIHEPQLGPCGFYLEPLVGDQNGIIFFTKQQNMIHLNGKPTESQSLHTDDMIQIATTCIKVQINDI